MTSCILMRGLKHDNAVNSIQRVYEMKVLGVTFTDTLSISPHVKYLVSNPPKYHSPSVPFGLTAYPEALFGLLLKPT